MYSELLQEIINKDRFRYKEWFLKNLAKKYVLKAIHKTSLSKRFGMDETNDIVLVVIIDRDTRKILF